VNLAKMTIAICDDDKETLKILISEIHDILLAKGIESDVYGYEDVLSWQRDFPHYPFDLAFLDIEMPTINGIDFAKDMRAKEINIPIIFVSNREDLVYEAFSSRPFGFIRKRAFKEDSERAINDFLRAKERERPQTIVVKRNGEERVIRLDEITYIESDRREKTIHMENGETYSLNVVMKDLERELVDCGFVCTYKGVMVNCRHIKVIREFDILLKNGESAPLSRRKSNEVRSSYMDYLSFHSVVVY